MLTKLSQATFFGSGWFLWQLLDTFTVSRVKNLKSTDIDLILTLSASEIALLIRKGELSSELLIRKCLDQITRTSELNAIAKLYSEEELLSQARNADELSSALRTNKSLPYPPLLGVPCLIKEHIAVAGMPLTCGIVGRYGCTAIMDAPPVKKLREAGCIILGVANLAELTWDESRNYVYGVCKNPHDFSRTPGGSSGGSAAAVAACLVPFAIGTDIQGSVRFPAFCCGTFGHKPTAFRISPAGEYPAYKSIARNTLNCKGIFARKAEDLWLVLSCMEQPPNPLSSEWNPANVNLDEYTMLDVYDVGVPILKPNAILQEKQRQVREYLMNTIGVKLLPDHDKILLHFQTKYLIHLQNMMKSQLYTAALMENDCTYHDVLVSDKKAEEGWIEVSSAIGGTLRGGHRKVNLLYEVPKKAFGYSEFTLAPLAIATGDFLYNNSDVMKNTWIPLTQQFKTELVSLLGPKCIILYPTYIAPAPKHHRPKLIPEASQLLALANLLGLPATNVPLDIDQDTRLPTGIQIISLPNYDHVTIRVAMELERRFGGWISPYGAVK